MINVIAIDSIRNLPINASTGLSIVGFYILGTIFFLIPCILATAELATSYPKTGGAYVWVREAFGRRTGFVNIWLQWIYNVVWFPTILVFIASTATFLFDPSMAHSKEYLIPTVIGVFFLATFFNLFGMRTASWLSTVGAIIGTIVPMLLIIVLGACWIFSGKTVALHLHASALLPSFASLHNVAFIVVILFSLIGFEMSAVHAGDVKNPKRDFPRALFISSAIIVVSLILSSLAIAVVIPRHDLNIVSGLGNAYQIFLNGFGLGWALPIVIVMIIVGAFAGMSAWVLGPAKGLMVSTEDKCLPKWFGGKSSNGSPVSILLTQALVTCLLTSFFLLFKSVSTFYWILSDLTGQLALIYYIILFAALIKLRYKKKQVKDGFRIPGGKIGVWIVGGVGIAACIVAILVGLIPPSSLDIGHIFKYELTLIGGIAIFVALPWIISRKQYD